MAESNKPADPKNPQPKGGKPKKGKRKALSARRLAGQIIRRVLRGQGTCKDQLLWSFAKRPPELRDRSLVTDMVYGTVRHLQTLDAIIARLSKRPLAKIDEGPLIHMRLALYQWLFLDRIPEHAIVHEAVENISHRGAKKFANGLLRSFGRLLGERHHQWPVELPRSQILPIRDGVFQSFQKPVFAHESEPWLVQVSGLPKSYIDKLIARFGFDKAQQCAFEHNRVPPLSVRCNLLKQSREELQQALTEQGFECEPGAAPESLRIKGLGDPQSCKLFRQGGFSVQDETAMQVTHFLKPEPGERVLDYCAAPGGKTMHIAEMMAGEGEVVATDSDPERLPLILQNQARLGHDNVQVLALSELPKDQRFDKVLLDVPCSNTGVLRRRVELRHRLDELRTERLHSLQRDILKRGLSLLKPRGALVYSTCSIEREENEDCVRAVLESMAGAFKLEEELLTLPNAGGDGGYVARIVAS